MRRLLFLAVLFVAVPAVALGYPPATITDITQSSVKVGGLDCGKQYRIRIEERNAANTGWQDLNTYTPTTAACPQLPPAPTADFSWSPQNPSNPPVQVTFTSTGTCPDSPCTFEWRHGPPGSELIGTGQTASFTYQGTGTKTVVLKVTDAHNRSASKTSSFDVTSAPPPPPPAKCANNLDDDNDGLVDLADPGCSSSTDDDESNAVTPPPGDTSSVSQYGITWTFSQPATVGHYANGDWWVLGPVTITSITPNASGGLNGWQPNPGLIANNPLSADCSGGRQALDFAGPCYNAALQPSLPYTAQPGTSILKAVSRSGHGSGCDGSNPCLQTAAVLTVVGSVPANNGATVFRPPYVGSSKPVFTTDNLPALPRLASTAAIDVDAPTLQNSLLDVQRPDPGYLAEEYNAFHPVDNVRMSNPYQPGISGKTTDAFTRALIVKAGDDEAVRRDLYIASVQRGIDVYAMRAAGMVWYGAGGTNFGARPPVFIAAWALGNPIASSLAAATRNQFAETGSVYPNAVPGGRPVWGQDRGGESSYWSHVRAGDDTGTTMDPYGLIDGAYAPGTNYQWCCASGALKGDALLAHLLPGGEAIWADQATLDYADRWVNFGQWTQPDPCAPVSQGGGPDPNSDKCILDPDLTAGSTFSNFSCQAGRECGRFPSTHGAHPDAQGWGNSPFQGKVWDQYR